MMMQQIFELALKNGLWAVLFLFLLFYILKDSAKREKKYQDTIEKLSKHLETVNDIKEQVNNIVEIITEPVIRKNSEVENGKK